jgi:uncharacterized protein YqfA (UPF0365 family)
MSAHWAAVHELVVELGGVCVAFNQIESEPAVASLPDFQEVVRAKLDATTAVSLVALGETTTEEEIEQTLAEAREAIGRAREMIVRMNALRQRNGVIRTDAEVLIEHSRALQRGIDREPRRGE